MKDEIKEIVEKSEKDYSKEPIQIKAFTMVIYKDTTDYNCDDVINKVIEYVSKKNGSYAYCVHDKDIVSEDEYNELGFIIHKLGEIKKSHIHIVAHLPYYVNINDIAVYIGIEDRWIQAVKPKKVPNALLYLTHIKYKDKYQYPLSCINSNIKDYIQYLYYNYINNSNKNILRYAITYIYNNPLPVNLKKIYEYLIEDCEFSIDDYKKYYLIIKDLVKENRDNQEVQDIKDMEYSKGYNDSTSHYENQFRLADNFGMTKIEYNNKHYILMQDVKKGK